MKFSACVFFILLGLAATCQEPLSKKITFTHQDTLRGSITPERAWWDLTYYHLDISVDPEKKFIKGKNTVQYKVLQSNTILQIDLQPPLEITGVIQNGKSLKVMDDGNAHFITLEANQAIGAINSLDVYYEGHPKEAVHPPWDGGFTWAKDSNGKHFVATSCQGIGASIWWPNKDHMYDEVDSMLISVTVPKGLMDVSNGRLRSVEHHEKTSTYNWFVSNPINNYGVNVNIADYSHFSEVYQGEKGPLDMDYYVLRENLEIAKVHFKDAPKMMEALEYWFGPYPFYEDGYKLVEVPYLGMEHQSSVTYGNHYLKGYLGMDLSGTGWGLKFDFIIVHESGHEWFANNITYKDAADMWIHEGFTNYSEDLFLDYYYGKKAASEFIIGLRNKIQNDKPIIGHYNVNNRGSGDMYAKGANILHTLRQLIEDDEKWRQILRGLNKTFYHQTVTSKQVEDYISEQTGIDLTEFFNQYLRTTKIPILEYKIEDGQFRYRWTNIISNFDMPVQVTINGKEQWIFPKANWKTLPVESSIIVIDPDFYVKVSRLK